MKVYTKSAGVVDLSCPEDIRRLHKDDLLEGLRRRDRYGGQVSWTVLQHSHLVQSLVPLDHPDPQMGVKAFWHDASEGLLGDLQKPIRDLLTPDSPYEMAHAYINAELARRHGWELGWEDEVREWDHRAFEIEVQCFIPRGQWAGFFGDRLPAPLTLHEAAAVETIHQRFRWA
jgi:hypothetical protein